MFESTLLNLAVWLPLVGAVLIALFGHSPTVPRRIALYFSLAVLFISILLFISFRPAVQGLQFQSRAAWIPAINSNYAIGVDGISLPLVVLNAFLSFVAVLLSWNITLRPQLYFSLMLVLETAVMGVFSASDLFLFFLFWELELAPMYLLIGIWGGPRREYAAMKFILYTVTGSAFMFVGILLLYFLTGAGTFDMVQIAAAAPNIVRNYGVGLQTITFLLLFFGFAVKVPVWPFHTWLPDAHVEAPTPISVLLAGVLLKMGGYGLLRLCVGTLPDAAYQLSWLIGLLAVINVLYGAFVAMVQTDLKKMIANSSVSHMGYVLLGLAALNQGGLEGSVLQMVTHGTITGLLFSMVGVVYDRTHTREIPLMQGLAARMPATATLFYVAALASLGLPLLSGFIAEFTVFIGAYPVFPIYTILAAAAIVITAGYLMWMLQRVFTGPIGRQWLHLDDASPREIFATGALVASILLIGIFPNVVLNMISVGVQPVVGLVAGR